MKFKISLNWKILFWSLSGATVSAIFTALFFPQFTGLVLLFFYIIPSNSFVPFPHEPAILFYGKIFGPPLTTLTAVIPTIIACILDYSVLTPVFSRTKLSNLKNTRIYRRTVLYFNKLPFLTISIAAFSPIPFYPVRILSVASGYPLGKYSLAVVLGKAPRYYLLAYFGAVFRIPDWVIGIFFLSLVFAAMFDKLRRQPKAKKISPAENSKMPGLNKRIPTTNAD